MAISAAIQTLSAAFSFGILLQAATGALFIYYRGHGSTIFQDGRRLVLVLFLLFAALWAQIDFVNLLLPTTAATACQATLIISTTFDQLARVGLEQFLLWSVGHGTRLTAERLILQGVLLARLIAGGLLVGFTRPQFAPVCLAQTSILPIAIVVLVLDAIIVMVLLIRAASLGMFGGGGDRSEQNRALVLSIFAFGFWTAMSVPLILGISTIILLLRTVLPANGLLVLVGVVTINPHALLSDREQITTPEAQSPFVQSMPPAQQIFQENLNNNGSPISNHNYTKSGSLFVVNPSTTPRESPGAAFANSPRNDNRGFTKMNEEVTVRDIGSRNAPVRPDRPERNAPGYRGSSGVFPSILSAPTASALAPQIRPNISMKTKDISGPTNFGPSPAPEKRGLFSFSKTPTKPSIRSLGISQPVALETDSGAQAFAKMQTIDLTTAALNERERREGASARAKLVANRPAPQPPTMTSQEALRKSISVRRKQMPAQVMEAMPTVAGSVSSSLEATGSSTSASLSPGREEIRRRSPRQTNTFDRSPIIDANTGRPMHLQRKNTSGGLPSNPRATRLMNPTPQPLKTNVPQQTVMFMNDIVYDNPGVVKTIIRDAPGMYAQRPKTAEKKKGSMDSTGPLRSADSVIHRPRPYTRDHSKDRSIFPSQPSPGHRRSRSGSSLFPARKSFLMAHPGSPTMLPPLPAPPTTAAALKRLLPNNTKSMTFDEKIQLLFPAPPNLNTRHHRRSSVPSLPRVPSVFMIESPQPQSPTEDEIVARRTSKYTSIASFLTNNAPPIPPKSEKRVSMNVDKERQTYRFSANTYRTLADEVGETWIPGSPIQNVQPQNALLGVPQRQSVLDDMRKSHWTVTTMASEEDEATTYWGSVHDDVPAINIPNARQNARSTFIKPFESKEASTIPSIYTVDSDDARQGEEIMTVMLESEEVTRSFFAKDLADTNRRSFFLDAEEFLGGEKTPASINERGWHKRIGDELSTFSERKEMRKSRKMPPPTPLLLNRTFGRKASVLVMPAEPSPPSDSPERAIAEIQAQLRRFEEPSRGSVASILRALPGGNDGAEGSDRLALLDNLEREMGQQENHWQRMQTNLDRDSMNSISMIMSPEPVIANETILSPESSQRSSRTLSRVSSRRTRVRTSLTNGLKSQMSSRTNSSESSDNSRASIWQQRLAEAQNKYMENAPVMLRKKSLNFLSVSKSHQLGSPTPPDSDESESDSGSNVTSESHFETEGTTFQELLQALRKEPARLWQHPLSTPTAAGRMWNPPLESMRVRSVSPNPPAQNVRPVQRRTQVPLSISSTELWTKPQTAVNKRPVVALWGSKPVRPASIATRRATFRPQRKSRRVTILPDIVESPVPLPNKRETLGIFRFPWGEKSDQPVYQPAFNPALLAGSTLNANLEARARQIENLEQSEYSSSFFDDYDDDFEGMDTDSDDDFDESTLWEIASLLTSNDVSSKQSLFPLTNSMSIEEEFDEESDEESAVPPAVMSVRPLATNTQPHSQLWVGKDATNLTVSNAGLPQPEPSIWNAMIAAPKSIVRSKGNSSDALPILISKDLWTSVESDDSSNTYSEMWQSRKLGTCSALESLWSPKEESSPTSVSGLFTVSGAVIRTTEAAPIAVNTAKKSRPSASALPIILSRSLWSRVRDMEEATQWLSKTSAAPRNTRTQLMWAPSPKVMDAPIIGLFDASIPRSVYRSSTAIPAAIYMVSQPRKTRESLSQLASSRLWSGCNKLPVERDWISESSIRPESPSIYSTSSSGSSSPVSDSSSIKSSSTKASSIWGPIAALKMPRSWFEKKSKKPTGSSVDDSKAASKIPVRQGAPLVSVRESRVLASRDLWEAKAPVEQTPGRNFRESVASKEAAITAPHYQHRIAALKNASWDDALTEAIAAGIQKSSLPRPVAKKIGWDSALNDAIFSSKPELQRPQCSPKMWANALAEAVNKSSIPRPVKTQKYDPAVLHPVFFTASLVSTTYDVHPAAIGHISKVLRPRMWTSSSPVAAPKSGLLWSKDCIAPRKVATELSLITELVRKAPIVRAVELPVLESKTFWQPTKVVDVQLNWIASTIVETPKTWTPRGHDQSQKLEGLGMWSAKVSASPSMPDMFADVKSQQIRKATTDRGLDLPVLESKNFWKPSSAVSVERNWISGVKSFVTWTARSQSSLSAQENKAMWTATTITLSCSPDMFAHMNTEPIRSTPRQKAVQLPVLESSSLWQPIKKTSTQRIWLKSAVVKSAKTWAPPQTAEVQIKNTNQMWTTTTTPSQKPLDMFAHKKASLVKKASASRPLLPRLNSNELFTITLKTSDGKVDWLHSTSKASQTFTWTAPSTNQATLPVGSMWERRPDNSLTPITMFEDPHSQLWSQKKRDEISLSQLESTELWRPNNSIPASPKNWLVNRRFSKVVFRY